MALKVGADIIGVLGESDCSANSSAKIEDCKIISKIDDLYCADISLETSISRYQANLLIRVKIYRDQLRKARFARSNVVTIYWSIYN